jgi:hypothetical protein
LAKRISCQYFEGTTQSSQTTTPVNSSTVSNYTEDNVENILFTPRTDIEPGRGMHDSLHGSINVAVPEDPVSFETFSTPPKDSSMVLSPDVMPGEFDWIFDGSLDFCSNLSLEPNPLFLTTQLSDQRILSPRTLSPPSLPLIPDCSMRSIGPRSLGKRSSQIGAAFLPCMLASYPAMMLRKETFPPFIHCVRGSESRHSNKSLPESLVNCMTIAQMFVTRGKETSKFMWRTIRMEQERIWLQVRKNNREGGIPTNTLSSITVSMIATFLHQVKLS